MSGGSQRRRCECKESSNDVLSSSVAFYVYLNKVVHYFVQECVQFTTCCVTLSLDVAVQRILLIA